MKKLLCLMMAVMLAACVGSSPQSAFYTLKAQSDGIVSNKALQIGVEPVKIPAFLDKPQIVMLQENGIQLNVSERNRWAEPLSTLLQRTLVNDLALNMPKSTIRAKTYGRESYDYVVVVDVNQFSGTFDKTLTLTAWWSLRNDKGDIVYRTQTTLSAPLKDSYEDLVMQQSRLIGELSQKIARKINAL